MNGNGELTETDERHSYVLCYGNGYGNGYGALEIRHKIIIHQRPLLSPIFAFETKFYTATTNEYAMQANYWVGQMHCGPPPPNQNFTVAWAERSAEKYIARHNENYRRIPGFTKYPRTLSQRLLGQKKLARKFQLQFDEFRESERNISLTNRR